MSRSSIVTACVCAATIAAVLAPSAAAGSDPAVGATFSRPTAAQTATLSATERSLLRSSAPQTIVMNPVSGDILSVSPASTTVVDIEDHSVCDRGNACFSTDRDPLADIGFYGGAGTARGRWSARDGYSSGNWTAAACWATRCGPKLSPHSRIAFTSDVTGTSFTIY